ncbi:hypothetical protein J6590_015241 [Homalodisca vitripennis]|nr:hypothetical protein J6590_015241 [Homalodisca vitripennis]
MPQHASSGDRLAEVARHGQGACYKDAMSSAQPSPSVFFFELEVGRANVYGGNPIRKYLVNKAGHPSTFQKNCGTNPPRLANEILCVARQDGRRNN